MNKYNEMEDTGLKVSVKIRNHIVFAKTRKLNSYVNNLLYLLDSDIEENQVKDRWITRQLYGWLKKRKNSTGNDSEYWGGRALRKLGISVEVYHFNESHIVFAGLELLREKIGKEQYSIMLQKR